MSDVTGVFETSVIPQVGEEGPWTVTAYVVQACTAETGFRAGYLSKAYYGVCPKETESAFLAGLEKGRGYRPNPPQAWPYYERMSQLEKQVMAATSEPDRERLKVQLRDAEWWAIHIDTCSCSYTSSGRN